MPKKEKELTQAEIESKENEIVIEIPDYTKKELEYRSFLIKRLISGKEQREESYDEFDGMDYVTWYNTNKKAANAYIAPAKNKEETRITTGTTKNKTGTLLNSLMNLNIEVDIQAFDSKNSFLTDFSTTLEALVRKSRQMEGYNSHKRRLVYKGGLDQGTQFIEEVNPQRSIIEKELRDKKWWNKKLKDIDWVTRLYKVYNECEINQLSGLKVFLGNIRKFFMDNQPYIFTVEYLDREVAQSYFGDWERWDNVPLTVKPTTIEVNDGNYGAWRLYERQNTKKIEVIKYQDRWKNEYQIMLNGVMMLPCGFPLSAISKDGKYTIAKLDIDPISFDFAYSKSTPADTKVSQTLIDFFLKAFIRKTNKSIDPPLAKKGGKRATKKIFQPKTVTHNLDPETIKEIGTNPGVTASEVQMYQIVKDVIDEMSLSSQFSSPGTDPVKTATQSSLDYKQNMLKIGNAIAGALAFEIDLYKRRVPNILEVWTAPVDTRIDEERNAYVNYYRSITTEATIKGSKTLLNIQMIEDKKFPEPKDIYNEEQLLSKEIGRDVAKVYLSSEMLRTLHYHFYYEATPTEKDTSELKRVLFMKNIQEAAAIWGIENLNLEGLKKRFAQIIKEDEDTFFIRGAQSQPMLTNEGQFNMPGGDKMSAQMTPKAEQTPSVNTLKGKQ